MYVGGIIGYCNASIKVDTAKNEAEVNGADYVGGLYGYMNAGCDPNIENCENSGAITGSGNYIGGLVGYAYADAYGTYNYAKLTTIDCTNIGDIKGKQYVGGLYGYAGCSSSALIEDCSNQSNIEAEAIVGCLAGELYAIAIKNCTNSGSTLQATKYITEDNNKYAYVGGYAGKGASAEKCTNTVDINYTEEGMYVGGVIGYPSEKI